MKRLRFYRLLLFNRKTQHYKNRGNIKEITARLDGYRSAIRLLLKIDFAILAIVGSIATILNFKRDEIFSFISETQTTIAITLFLICISIIVDYLISYYPDIKIKYRRNTINIIVVGLTLTTLTNLVLFAFIVGQIVGYSDEYTTAHLQQDIKQKLQYRVELFYRRNKHYPLSLKSITEQDVDLNDIIIKSGFRISYYTDTLKYYKLNFSNKAYQTTYTFYNVDYKDQAKEHSISVINQFIVQYYEGKGRIPHNLSELKYYDSKMKPIIDEYVHDGLMYWNNESGYYLGYKGEDNILYTEDDDIKRWVITKRN